MTYEQYLNQAIKSIKSHGTEQFHTIGNDKIACKLNCWESPDQKYTRCELCEVESNEIFGELEDKSYNSEDPYYLDDRDYQWAMEQDNG